MEQIVNDIRNPILLANIHVTMSSSKEDGTAAASETNEDSKQDEAPAKLCSACEKKSNTAKLCNWCKCVCYCDGNCQNRHHSEHKEDCMRIKKELDKRGEKFDLGTEKEIGPLRKLPPREECPICMRALPLHDSFHMYFACCGKIICGGCDMQHQMKSREQAVPRTCAFCRTAVPESDEKYLVQLRKRVKLKDPAALCNMAMEYGRGELGLPVDEAKCIDLLRESACLGFPPAHYQLGRFHDNGEMGLEQNEEEALKYWEKAAEGGHLASRHNAGCIEGGNGNHVAAIRHLRLSASGGCRSSMDDLIESYFEEGLLHHADLAETLQAFYRSRGEMRSEDRVQYIEYLKENYKVEYDD